MTIVVQSPADPQALVPELRREVAALDPALPLANVKPLADLVDASVAARRFAMVLVVLFAAVALMLSAVGLFAILSHLAGLVMGLVAARAGATLLATWLFGVTAADPVTLVSVAATLGVVSLCAMAIPVRRATQVDPSSLLRTEV